MKAIRYLCLFFYVLGLFPLAACLDEPPHTTSFTIGILNVRSSLQPMIDTFKDGMAALGYIEGETIHYQYNGPLHNSADLAPAAQAFVNAKVDLIFALGTPATLAAKQAVAGTTIPVVFAPLNDPVGFGIVESLTHPGSNLTGIRTGGYVPKELEWLLGVAPDTQRIFVPHDPNDDVSVQSLTMLLETAARFQTEVIVHEIHSADDIATATAPISPEIDAILILPTTLVLEHIDLFVAAAIKHKLPLAVPSFLYVEVGALVSYGSAYSSIGAQVSRLASKILQGVPPADLPVETAEFYLGLNLQTAEAIDLLIPNKIIQQAHFIVR